MGFNFKWVWGLQLLVLGAGTFSPANTGYTDALQTTIIVINSAKVSPGLLQVAERESARIFRAAGMEILWVNCGTSAPSPETCPPLDANDFVLHIVPTGATSSELVFGVAFLGDDGRGHYCDVFFDRIQGMTNEFGSSPAQVLGMVITHELGHLFLGSNAHSPFGIMMPVWNHESLRLVSMGNLHFNRDQAFRMRDRLSSERATLQALGDARAAKARLLLLSSLQ